MTADLHIDFWAVLTQLLIPLLEIAVVGASAFATLIVATVAVVISIRSHRLSAKVREEERANAALLARERLATKLDEYRLGIQRAITKPVGTAAGGNSYPEALRIAAILDDPQAELLVERWRALEVKVTDAERTDSRLIDGLLTEIAAMWVETTYWAASGTWKPSEELKK